MSNPFWEYSLVTYQVDEVAKTCLSLQDLFGMDVNQLLYAAWLASNNQCLNVSHLAELDALVAEWRDSVVRPLRALRRQLRDWAAATAVHDELKALELQAEHEQQDMMYAFYQGAPVLVGADRPLRANLVEVALLAPAARGEWEKAIERLSAAVPL
jgi:uncharacterized protein (TIGR02444 family)